jgi:hypothetical protein
MERTGGEGSTSPINQTVDAIMDMAVSLPALQKLGERIGVSVDATLSKTPANLEDNRKAQYPENNIVAQLMFTSSKGPVAKFSLG